MPLYLIERNFAEQVKMTEAEMVAGAGPVIAEKGNHWLSSFLSEDKLKMYCLYESPNTETIVAAAERLGLPADVITRVDEINPKA